MLELAERLGNAGFRWLVEACARPGHDGDASDRRRRGAGPAGRRSRSRSTGLRALCRDLVERSRSRRRRPGRRVDREAVLQRAAPADDRLRRRDRRARAGRPCCAKPLSSGWESGAWVLDFVELVGVDDPRRFERDPAHDHRRAGPRPAAGTGRRAGEHEFAELHDDLRAVARDLLGDDDRADGDAPRAADWARWPTPGGSGWRCPRRSAAPGATFAEVAVVAEEMGRAATASPYLGTAVPRRRRAELGRWARGQRTRCSAALATGAVRLAVASHRAGTTLLGRSAVPHRVIRRVDPARAAGPRSWSTPSRPTSCCSWPSDAAGDPVLVHVDAGALIPRASTVERRNPCSTPPGGSASWSPTGRRSARSRSGASTPTLPRSRPQRARRSRRGGGGVRQLRRGRAMIDATVAYVAARHQFDRPIGSFQAVKHACADMAVQQAVGRELLSAAVEAVADERARRLGGGGASQVVRVRRRGRRRRLGDAAPRWHRLHVGERHPPTPQAGGPEPIALRLAGRPSQAPLRIDRGALRSEQSLTSVAGIGSSKGSMPGADEAVDDGCRLMGYGHG